MATPDDLHGPPFLPDMCGVRALFGVVIIGELLAIVLSIAGADSRADWLERLSLLSLFIQWIGLSAAAILCWTRRWLGRMRENTAAIVSYGLILLAAYGVCEISWWVVNPLSGPQPLITLSRPDFLLRVLGVSAIVGALALRYFFVQHHWKLRTVSEADARLEALQARIRPHFLFNCMNTIASLTRTDAKAAERAIEDLADLFRASLARARSLVSLEDEIELVRGYLNIEALRLGDRLRTEWQIDAACLDAQLPLLTLQPLVENAIYHGIEPLPKGGTVTIEARAEGSAVRVRITNPLGDDGVVTARRDTGNQLAQENVRQRLTAHFGGAGRLDIERGSGLYQVDVSIPYG